MSVMSQALEQTLSTAICSTQRRAPARQTCRRKVTCMAVSYDKVAGAYAKALVDLAQEKNILDKVHSDIDALSSAFSDNPQVKDFLYNPMVPSDRKKDMLKSLAKDIQPETLNFIYLLQDLDRLVAAEQIFANFQQTYCKVTATQEVHLRAAVEMNQEQLFLVAQKLQDLTGSKNIKLHPTTDKSLIAGFVLEYGSSQIDLSLRGQLAKIEAELLEGEPVSA